MTDLEAAHDQGPGGSARPEVGSAQSTVRTDHRLDVVWPDGEAEGSGAHPGKDQTVHKEPAGERPAAQSGVAGYEGQRERHLGGVAARPGALHQGAGAACVSCAQQPAPRRARHARVRGGRGLVNGQRDLGGRAAVGRDRERPVSCDGGALLGRSVLELWFGGEAGDGGVQEKESEGNNPNKLRHVPMVKPVRTDVKSLQLSLYGYGGGAGAPARSAARSDGGRWLITPIQH